MADAAVLADLAAAKKAKSKLTKANTLEAYLASGSELRTKRPEGMVKRSVAIQIGYIGTAFRGGCRCHGNPPQFAAWATRHARILCKSQSAGPHVPLAGMPPGSTWL
jgi:hypothetical protein